MSRKNRFFLTTGVFGLAGCLVLLPCSQKVLNDPVWQQSAASLLQIGRALHNYQSVTGKLPPAVITSKDGKPLYSWRVALLPYLEQDNLYNRLKLDEPWDSPHNLPLVEETPRCYIPALGGHDGPGLTRYQAFVGPGTAFERPGLSTWRFPDGPENTILVAEASKPVPWAKPTDLDYSPDKPLPSLDCGFPKASYFLCYQFRLKAGFNACFADGSVRFIPADADEKTIRSLITRNGGEKVNVSRVEW